MTILPRWIAIAAAVLMATPAIAGLRDIHTEKLPQEAEVQKAYTDMATIEDLVRDWVPSWRYQTPKADVVSLVKASLGSLQKALPSAPENEELLLLTGLVAHYAYNIDIDGTRQVVVQSLEKAQKLSPQDYRPAWFLGDYQCQASGPKNGMENLLSIEHGHPWDQLPLDFWEDYFSCANLTNMPAHGLRAGDHLAKLNAPASKGRDALMQAYRKRFTTPDTAATYPFKDVWFRGEIDSPTVLKNYMFGFSITPPEGSRLGFSDVNQGQCTLRIETSPHAGKAGRVFPSFLIMVRQPKAGETLSDFLKAALPDGYGSVKPVTVAACPAHECMAIEGVKPGQYKAEGDGHIIMMAFKRDAPEFPGLLLETPASPPTGEPGEAGKMTYYHPSERLHRLEGTLYYLVGLDVAASVLDKAESDHEMLLRSFQVE